MHFRVLHERYPVILSSMNHSLSSRLGLERPPRREVHCADAIPWMKECGVMNGACAITSLPDVSEVNLSLARWRAWFTDAASLVIESISPESAALFFQSDIKHAGEWVDKGALVTRAAEDAGAKILFHKIVCRRPPGMLTMGRPGYTH